MARSYPPAWYPDPRDPARLRRWNGRSWTNDVRPFPSWLRAMDLSPGPGRRNRNRLVRRLWSASTLTFTLAGILLLSLSTSLRSTAPEERVDDTAFVAAADEACGRLNREVLEPYRRGATRNDPEALAAAADSFAVELRRLPVSSADRVAVDRWIEAWSTWAAAGHKYAEAVDAGNDKLARSVSAKSVIPRTEINRFAYANGLTACVLDIN